MKYKCFFLGVGIWIVLLLVVGIQQKNLHQPSMVEHAITNMDNLAASDVPVYITNASGLREEQSRSSVKKTAIAIDVFLRKVARSNLRCTTKGELVIKAFAGKATVVHAKTEDTFFDVHYSPTDTETVTGMNKIGIDENGLPRDFNKVVSAAGPDLDCLAAWADPNKYPIQSTVDDVKGNVTAFLQELNIGGTDRYLLESVRQEQLGVYHLPFYIFTFTTKENFGRGDNANRDEIDITVRVGGTDLKKGEAELVYFDDYGYLWRKLETQNQKTKLPTVPRLNNAE